MTARREHVLHGAPALPEGTTHVHAITAPLGACLLVPVVRSTPGELVLATHVSIGVLGFHLATDCPPQVI